MGVRALVVSAGDTIVAAIVTAKSRNLAGFVEEVLLNRTGAAARVYA